MKNSETLREAEKKHNPMKGLLATGMIALPFLASVAGAMGVASSAEQARDVLDELIKDVNTHSATYEGLKTSGEALKDFVHVTGENTVALGEGTYEDQIQTGDQAGPSGESLYEDLHAVEAYVRDVYGDNVPAEFLELFDQAESEISYNQNLMNQVKGAMAATALGLGGAYLLTRSKSKDPTSPTSIDV